MHSIIRDNHGRLAPLVRSKHWPAASVKRSRDRTDRIASARKQREARLATTQWSNELDARGIAELEAAGIPWAAVQYWLGSLNPRELFAARMFVGQVLQTLADGTAERSERLDATRELYRRLIDAGIVD